MCKQIWPFKRVLNSETNRSALEKQDEMLWDFSPHRPRGLKHVLRTNRRYCADAAESEEEGGGPRRSGTPSHNWQIEIPEINHKGQRHRKWEGVDQSEAE